MEQHELGAGSVSISDPGTAPLSPYDFAGGRRWRETWHEGGVSAVLAPETAVSELLRYRLIKRFIDLLLVAVASPVLLPFIAVIGLMVKFTSPGPIFFSHRRLCKNGAFFSMWKFRTMSVNSSEVLERYLTAHPLARAEWNKTHKLHNDPRVTRLGRTLRRLSLDELPQVWNVLSGQMSLVGPRPIVAAEVEKYGKCFRCYTSVKPGVTGLWQVSGRSTLSYEARVKLDCEYAKKWTLFRDLRILFATFKSVVNQEGAY